MSPSRPDTHALLAAARGARAPRAAKARVDARLVAKLGVAAVAASAPAAPAAAAAFGSAALATSAAAPIVAPAAAASGAAFGVKGLLLAAFVVGTGAVIGATMSYGDRESSAAGSVVAGASSASLAQEPRPSADRPLTLARSAVREHASDAAAPETPGSTTKPRSSGAVSAPSGDLGRDSALMAQALRALRDGDPDAALRAIDAAGSGRASGPLAEERQAARVLALCAAGRTDDAQAAAADFVARFPTSVQASRVRASCAGRAGGQ